MNVRYYIDDETGQPHVYGHGVRIEGQTVDRVQAANAPEKTMSQSKFPDGWDAERVRRVLDSYDQQSEDEAVAEDEAGYHDRAQSLIEVPVELVPTVRELIAKHKKAS